MKVFREAVRAHAINDRRSVQFEKNEKINKVKSICTVANFPWMVYASWLNDDFTTFKVKTLNPYHKCAMVFKNKFLSSYLIAKKYVDTWRGNLERSFTGFSQQVRTDLNMDALKWQFYRTKNIARK